MLTLQNRHVKLLVRLFRIVYYKPRHSTGCDSDTDCVNWLLRVLSLLYFISFMNNGKFCPVTIIIDTKVCSLHFLPSEEVTDTLLWILYAIAHYMA